MLEQRIETHINDILTGDAQKNALDFVKCLRVSDMTFERGKGYWEDKHYWMIKYKGEFVCFILIGGDNEKDESWTIWSDDSGSNWFENYPLDEHTKEIIYMNVDLCENCGGCIGGTSKTIFGKTFDIVCRTAFKFDNPDHEVVECTKKLVELRKKDIQKRLCGTDSYTDINALAIDEWADNDWEWSIPISREVFAEAKNGNWDVLLTPTKPVPHEWFSPFIHQNRLDGVKLLGLASGGGQQMPIFTVLGADCTVLDYSKRQLDREREVAEREGYDINFVRADMTKRLPFDDSFDVIFHPVSNCYIEDVYHVWNECYRVLKPGGVLLAGMDNGFNFIVEDFTVRPLVIANKLPYNPLKNPEQMKHTLDEDGSVQFSHTFNEQIGGQLKAGFVITAAYEDFNNEPDAIADGIPSFWATRAVKLPLGWEGKIHG